MQPRFHRLDGLRSFMLGVGSILWLLPPSSPFPAQPLQMPRGAAGLEQDWRRIGGDIANAMKALDPSGGSHGAVKQGEAPATGT